MNQAMTSPQITLVISNLEQVAHGQTSSQQFDHAGGSIGCQGCDWLLDDRKHGVQPTHCEIRMREGGFCVIDRCAQTYLNGHGLALGLNTTVRLNDGDRLRVGAYSLVVHLQIHEHNPGSALRHLSQRPVAEMFGSAESLPDTLESEGLSSPAWDIAAAPQSLVFEQLSTPLDQRYECDPLRALDATQRLEPVPNSPADVLDPTHYGRSSNLYTPQDLATTRHEAVSGAPNIHSGVIPMPQYPASSSELPQRQPHSPADLANTDSGPAAGLIQGLECNLGALAPDAAQALLFEAGQALRAAIEGMAALYGTQAGEAQRLRLLHRTLQPIEDNPLRLGQSYEDTVRALFSHERSCVHLSPEAAIRESLAQARHHNTAVIKAIGASLEALLRAFSPDVLLQRFQRYGTAPDSAQSEGWAWQMYTHYYNELASSRQQGFEKLFWEVFEQAYDRALRAETP